MDTKVSMRTQSFGSWLQVSNLVHWTPSKLKYWRPHLIVRNLIQVWPYIRIISSKHNIQTLSWIYQVLVPNPVSHQARVLSMVRLKASITRRKYTRTSWKFRGGSMHTYARNAIRRLVMVEAGVAVELLSFLSWRGKLKTRSLILQIYIQNQREPPTSKLEISRFIKTMVVKGGVSPTGDILSWSFRRKKV